MQPIITFLNVEQDVSDLTLLPTMVGETEEECTDFSLRNPSVFKNAERCSYEFLKLLEGKLSSIAEAYALCGEEEKQQFISLCFPIYDCFRISKYRVFRAIAVVLAKILNFDPLSEDVCPGIRQYFTSEISLNDPDSEVRLEALLDEKVSPNLLLMDDNETVRTFATAEATSLVKNELIGEIIVGEFRGARVFALCQLMPAEKLTSRLAKQLEDIDYEVLEKVVPDIILAAILTEKEENLLKCEFFSLEEFILHCLIIMEIKRGDHVDRSLFCGYKEKYGLNSPETIRNINEALEELRETPIQGNLLEIGTRYQAFCNDGSCQRVFNELFETFIDEFREQESLRVLFKDALSVNQARDMIEDDDGYLDYLDNLLRSLANELDGKIIGKLLEAMPNNFPHTEAILEFFEELNLLQIEGLRDPSKQTQMYHELETLAFYLSLRLKEAGERTSGATDFYCRLMNKATNSIVFETYELLCEGVTDQDENERITTNIERIEEISEAMTNEVWHIERSTKEFSNLIVEDLCVLFLVAYCSKYYCFKLEDLGHQNEITIVFEEVEKRIFSMLPPREEVTCCVHDISMLQGEFERLMREMLKSGSMFEQVIALFNYFNNYETGTTINLLSLESEIRPEANIGSIFAQNINIFFRNLKTDLKNAKREWLKIALWCKMKNLHLEVLDGMDPEDLERVHNAGLSYEQ